MIRYSHVALWVPLLEPSGQEVSHHLGVEPTLIRESKGSRSRGDGTFESFTSYSWLLESNKDANHQPIVRVHALLDEVEKFSDKLLSLDPKFKRWIDIVFHVTPQHPQGITGEFDWISLPYETMGRLSRLRLNLSYEAFWFDHADWRLPWYRKLMRKLNPIRLTRR